MRIKPLTTAPLLAAMTAGAAIAAAAISAPVASAADIPSGQAYSQSMNTTQCQSPGNVQFNATPPQIDFHPYGGLKYATGDNNHSGQYPNAHDLHVLPAP